MCGRKLWGKRLGIVGMGRIGQALARRAKAFGMQVHYHNRKPVSERIVEELGATTVVGPADSFTVDAQHNLVVDVRAEGAAQGA